MELIIPDKQSSYFSYFIINAWNERAGSPSHDTYQSLNEFAGFPGGTSKEPTWHCRGIRDTGFIQGSRRSPGGGNGSPLKYFLLKNPKDRGAWEPGRLQSMGLQRVRCNWNYKILRLKRYALETRLCSTGLSYSHCKYMPLPFKHWLTDHVPSATTP